MYWVALQKILSRYSLRLTYPLSLIIGIIGYKIESLLSDKYTPSLEPVKDKREERLLKEDEPVESLKEHSFVPKTIFERNVPGPGRTQT